MIEKHKFIDSLNHFSANIGLTVMTMATIVGMLELPEHNVNRYVLSSPSTNLGNNSVNLLNNPLRREKEEASPEYVSYSESQRTVERSGRL